MPPKYRMVHSVLRGGFSDDYPFGSQKPSNQAGLPPFLDMQNMVYHRGVLRPAWRWTALDATTYTNPVIEGNNYSRQFFNVTNAQYVVGGALISTGTGNQKAHIVITDGEIFVNGQPMNPTRSFTLDSATSGMPGISLYDPAAEARGIKPNDLFRSLTDDTEDNWQPVVSVTYPYVTVWNIVSGDLPSTPAVYRRTFVRGVIPGKVSWCLLNGDLYVAAQCAGVDPAGTSGWGILRVADIFESPQEAEYIMATWDVTGSLDDASILPEIEEINGLQATADGRLVIIVREGSIGNRVRWSSFRDLTKWDETLNEEAGFTDLPAGKADAKCLCKIGETMVVYFADSIHVGLPTHDQIVPFSWEKTSIDVGTLYYRGAIECQYGNLYLGTDGHPRLFDGETSRKLVDDSVLRFTSGPTQLYVTGETVEGEIVTMTMSVVAGSVSVA